MITPLLSHDKLDCAGLERLIEHIIGGGVHGLFILGTTGEGTSLSHALRTDVIERTCRQVAGRVPVLVCVVDTAFEESVSLARYAAEEGADAVVAAAPFVMPSGQADLRAYLAHLVSELPLPLYLYNVPPLIKSSFDAETIRWAMEQPGILGVKDSSGDLIYFQRICAGLARRADWSVFIGPEELIAEAVALGGHGGVAGGANLFPRLYVALYEAARDGDASRVRALRSAVLEVTDRLYRIENHPSAVVKGIKCALARLGICGDVMAEPFQQFASETKTRIHEAVEKLQHIIQETIQQRPPVTTSTP